MKTQRNILMAFILNLLFSVFEIIGGFFTGSVAIISDAVHDLGDAASIGISYFLEKKSNRQPDGVYTYGYGRFSVMGSVITTVILIFGSVGVICNGVLRIIEPKPINYNGMIVFAVVGVTINFLAAYFTREGDSVNQKAVNLHLLEDVLGWVVVLVGAVVMRFTDVSVIDPIMSICVAVFILVNALKNLKEVIDIFLDKIPKGIDLGEIRHRVLHIDGVCNVHHIHVWTTDGSSIYATMHIVSEECSHGIKESIRQELKELGICHVTLEFESSDECCVEENCVVEHSHSSSHNHRHHHH